MRDHPVLAVAVFFAALMTALPVTAQSPSRQEGRRTFADVIAAARDDEWRDLDPATTLYMDLPSGRVVLELAPEFAPGHVANLKALVRDGYYDGGAVVRSQDNYVVQWAIRPLSDGEELPTDFVRALPPEFEVSADELTFNPIPDGDVYAPDVGFVRGFPTGRDPESGLAWMTHCYGVVGVPRGSDPTSGDATGLYATNGRATRHLDRNATMVGRVVAGMEHLATLPRGTEALGFYASEDERVPIQRVRIGSSVPPGEREDLQILRTESSSFHDYVLAVRSRQEDWFVHSWDRIDLCNVYVPTRRKPS